MLPAIPLFLELILCVIGGGLIGGAIGALIVFLTDKKTLLTGPISSGKTTFLQYLLNDKIPPGPSGAPRSYKVKDAVFDYVTDLSGAEAWLKSKFDEYIKRHDYILFFFDLSEFLKDEMYRADSFARIDMIHRNATSSQKILMVGTHVDKLIGKNYKTDVERFFAGKPYQSVLNHIVYVDTTKKECVKTIFDELKK